MNFWIHRLSLFLRFPSRIFRSSEHDQGLCSMDPADFKKAGETFIFRQPLGFFRYYFFFFLVFGCTFFFLRALTFDFDLFLLFFLRLELLTNSAGMPSFSSFL